MAGTLDSLADSSAILGVSSLQHNLNEKLNTQCIDISSDDKSVKANVTRTVLNSVGNYFSPRQLLVVLRLLKAITFCFIILTIFADLMYIFFVEMVASDEVQIILGGMRDKIIRIYGVGLAITALLIELDNPFIATYFSGLKGFIPRSLLLFFVSTVTNAAPIHSYTKAQMAGDDDLSGNDDANATIVDMIPQSAVVFQMVSSFVLGLCAFIYFVFGVLCFDRFTSRAFLSNRDPVASTTIPQSSTPQYESTGDNDDLNPYEGGELGR